MRIKVTVSTGWANGDHVDYYELPAHWENLSDQEKESWISEAAAEYLHETCEASGELVEDDEGEG